jgi:hypothetical protein
MKRSTPAVIMAMFLFALLFWTDRPKASEALPSRTELVVHGVSYHFDRSQEWNERNLGLGLKLPQGNGLSYQIGFYDNSYGRQTWYAITQKEWTVMGVQTGIFAGKVTGYRVPVAAGLMVSSNNLTFRIVPPVGSQTSGVIALELRKGL